MADPTQIAKPRFKINLCPGKNITVFCKDGRIVEDDSTDGEAWTIQVDAPVTITLLGPRGFSPTWRDS